MPSNKEVLTIHSGIQVSVRQPWAASPGPEASCPEAHLDRTANTSRESCPISSPVPGALGAYGPPPCRPSCVKVGQALCPLPSLLPHQEWVMTPIGCQEGQGPHGGGKPVRVDGVTSSSLWSSFVSPFFTFSLTFKKKLSELRFLCL